MPKSKDDRAEMFSLLAGGLDADQVAPTPTPETVEVPSEMATDLAPISQPAAESDASKRVNESIEKRKSRAKTGKRSDDAYMQTGMFLPVALVQEVKGYLAFDGNQQTIGDLTEGLLQAWANKKKAELAKRLSE